MQRQGKDYWRISGRVGDRKGAAESTVQVKRGDGAGLEECSKTTAGELGVPLTGGGWLFYGAA